MTTATVSLSGQYFDGRQPVGSAATLVFTGQQARLIGAQLDHDFHARELRVSPRVGRTERFLALPNGGQFLCPDHPLLDRLPHDSQGEGLVAWLEARVALAIAGIALVAALMLGGYFFGLPAAAEQVARHIPLDTEHALGEQVLTWLDGNKWFAPSQLDEKIQFFLRKDFAELTQNLPLAAHYRLEFRHAPLIGANAFALPGGTIVITDAMVNAAKSQDEVAAVLAHEIGHVERRHALRHLLQDSAVAVVVATVTSDAASLSVAVAGLPTLLAQAKYSRDFESEADDFAFALLKQQGRSPEAFATFMERLAGEDGEKGEKLDFLSTHPMTAERVQRARAAVHSDTDPR
jgi:predicted Zn-dependent protease